MKKIIFCSFALLSLLGSCKNRWQTVEYNGVSVQIPSDWGNKYTETPKDEIFFLTKEYQISAWSKEDASIVAVQWIDAKIEGYLYINLLIEWYRQFPIFESLVEALEDAEIEDVDFLNTKAKRCYFVDTDSLMGEIFAFTKNEYSYAILIAGDKKFYKSYNYNHILNSIEPNFSGEPYMRQESIVEIAETDDDFTRYEFRNYSLSVPNTMELRDENSKNMALIKSLYLDKLQTIKKIDVGDFNFVFQPAGTDDIDNIERMKKAVTLYARILINYQEGATDDFFRWNENFTCTQAEYDELNKIFKNDLLAEVEQAKQIGIDDRKLLNISDIEIAKNANKFVYVKQQYERTGNKGDVRVVDYYLHNNDEMVKLKISYRISESDLWETDFDKIIDTFSFNSKK